MPQTGQHSERAILSDLIDEGIDYGSRARQLSAALSVAGVAPGAILLHAQCGTGRLLAALSADYTPQGFEPSTSRLAMARERLGPPAQLWQGGLPDFRPPAQADVVFCDADALGGLRKASALEAGLRALAASVRPGGVLLLSPGPAPEEVLSGQAIMDTYDGDGIKIVRSAVARVLRQRYRLDYFWMVGRDHQGVETFEERVERTLWPHAVLREMLSDVGLSPHRSDAAESALWLYCHSS